jgi:hypothetical protein
LVIDILDPHALSLEDAPAKAAGLAEYAKKDASSFGRIELIIVDGGKMKRLDVSDEGHQGPSKIRWRADTDKLRRTSVVPALQQPWRHWPGFEQLTRKWARCRFSLTRSSGGTQEGLSLGT